MSQGTDPHFIVLAKSFYARNGIDAEVDDAAEIEVELRSRRMRIFPSQGLEGRVLCCLEFADAGESGLFSGEEGLKVALQFNGEALLAEEFRVILDENGVPGLVASFVLASLNAETLTDAVKEGFATSEILVRMLSARAAAREAKAPSGAHDVTILR